MKRSSNHEYYAMLCRSSSFILSNISTLASTAIPIDKITPATPARVSTIGLANINTIKNSANTANMDVSSFSQPFSLELSTRINKYINNHAEGINKSWPG